ncbi:isoamyl acetate-hydrolyzing esterase Ecym_4642 [Eremothecium cymbalariae DBVPG|uniref:SGNH hydrolase-type esterase domain-containing protein n=1 Tax=Eremothecium cymbalariae (strain CBS 270.75 / DBVPG 7215 / KCTC 17166 / NRRL Y-17582) TaxID=931890 RepID=G8JSE3_ERECY|nr:hypothetical protein Ecym_4642 [Eremothecium cymbalariae DBVPG\
MDYKKFLMFGDSITEYAFQPRTLPDSSKASFCFGGALTSAYVRRLQVLQRGFSGYNSRWGLKLLPKILDVEDDIVIAYVFFGTNDAARGNHQEVPIDEYKNNISDIIKMLQANGIKVILVGPGLLDSDKWRVTDNIGRCGDRSSEYHKVYSDALQELSKEFSTGFVNLFDAFLKQGGDNWRDLLSDGLHYSGQGYEIFYNELMSVIKQKYPDLAPENLPFKFPLWEEVSIDGSNI